MKKFSNISIELVSIFTLGLTTINYFNTLGYTMDNLYRAVQEGWIVFGFIGIIICIISIVKKLKKKDDKDLE